MLHRHHRAREGQRKVSPSGPTPMSGDQIGKLQMAGWQHSTDAAAKWHLHPGFHTDILVQQQTI